VTFRCAFTERKPCYFEVFRRLLPASITEHQHRLIDRLIGHDMNGRCFDEKIVARSMIDDADIQMARVVFVMRDRCNGETTFDNGFQRYDAMLLFDTPLDAKDRAQKMDREERRIFHYQRR